MFSELSLILISFLWAPPDNPPGCLCKNAVHRKFGGGHQQVNFDKKITLKHLQGRILDIRDDPVFDAIVEVFHKGKKINACSTDDLGRFCFLNLPNGLYKLRISSEGFNVSYFSAVEINRSIKQKKKAEMTIYLEVGT